MKSLSFHKRLFYSTYALVIAIIAAFTIYLYHHERSLRIEALQSIFITYADGLSIVLDSNAVNKDIIADFQKYVPNKELRITVIDESGVVIFDTETSRPDTLTNHYSRPEIRELDNQKVSYAIRRSDTMDKKFFYAAKNYGSYIIRCSLPYSSTTSFLNVNKGFIWIVLLILLVATIILYHFANKLGNSISLLRKFASKAQSLQSVDSTHMLFPENDLGDISRIIVDIYSNLNQVKDELLREREKLLEHIQLSNEGIIIFSKEKKELVTNKLFIQFANIISDSTLSSAEEILLVPELQPLTSFIYRYINDKRPPGELKRESLTITKNGKIFRVECLVFQDKSFEIILSDITKQEEENRIKRQLTQNVAHELKTPVSSIQGYLETIINTQNLGEDKKNQFIARCYSQAVRLADLLRDISQLNRLDEASEMFELQDVHVTDVVNNIVDELSGELEQKSISTRVDIDSSVKIQGNTSLVYSIFRNLMDNSIAYAGDGVRISISCYHSDDSYYYFSFSDTGVGISEEHLNRLFERFYRVDTGRSRKLGGTGLGLAIVKNAVLYHKGTISAKNLLTGGLEFLFSLKKKNTP
ncbi:MAG: two-component sensor histidine kinase [Prevotellaceae bacterium]|jgi:two-component system OmpR family sensor kinase|nr:two-component sensor histidine kinase [Prevotellaceae bacterium]